MPPDISRVEGIFAEIWKLYQYGDFLIPEHLVPVLLFLGTGTYGSGTDISWYRNKSSLEWFLADLFRYSFSPVPVHLVPVLIFLCTGTGSI